MPVILPPGKESRWLKPTNTLTEILDMLKKYPTAKMDGYPLDKMIERPEPCTIEMLRPHGEALQFANEPKLLPRQNHYGHKKKSDVSHWLGNKPI